MSKRERGGSKSQEWVNYFIEGPRDLVLEAIQGLSNDSEGRNISVLHCDPNFNERVVMRWRFWINNNERLFISRKEDGKVEVSNPLRRPLRYLASVIEGAIGGSLSQVIPELRLHPEHEYMELPKIDVGYSGSSIEDMGEYLSQRLYQLQAEREQRPDRGYREHDLFMEWLRQRDIKPTHTWQRDFELGYEMRVLAEQVYALATKLDIYPQSGHLYGEKYSIQAKNVGTVYLLNRETDKVILKVCKDDLIAPAKLEVGKGVCVELLREISEQLREINRDVGSQPFSVWLQSREWRDIARVLQGFTPIQLSEAEQLYTEERIHLER